MIKNSFFFFRNIKDYSNLIGILFVTYLSVQLQSTIPLNFFFSFFYFFFLNNPLQITLIFDLTSNIIQHEGF